MNMRVTTCAATQTLKVSIRIALMFSFFGDRHSPIVERSEIICSGAVYNSYISLEISCFNGL